MLAVDDLGFEAPAITSERVQKAICEGENIIDSEVRRYYMRTFSEILTMLCSSLLIL